MRAHNYEIKTERLLLRPMTVEDADAVWKWVSDERVARYMVYPTYTDMKKLIEWLSSIEEFNGEYHFGFVRLSDGELIGSGSIGPHRKAGFWSFGYNFRYDCWGMGYATEAAKAMIKFAQDHFGITHFCSSHVEPNVASGHVMEKCGLHFVGYGVCEKLDGSCRMRSKEFEGVLRRHNMRIETERLIITEMTMDMAQDVHLNSLDEDVRRFVPDEVFETIEDARETIEFIMSQYGSKEGPLIYAVITKDADKNIGYVQLVPVDDGKWEIGYHVAKAYTGNGYATEAVKAFLPVITEYVGITEVYGIRLLENVASGRVLDKCGFETFFTGEGPYHDGVFEISKGVWKK
ncbi:MAG: GNAT family N-acetyltransferase [Lachnospiraceae bacterium]|nr:GNAT family N-acetyltransferase [Lachnospiraceae bacterium]